MKFDFDRIWWPPKFVNYFIDICVVAASAVQSKTIEKNNDTKSNTNLKTTTPTRNDVTVLKYENVVPFNIHLTIVFNGGHSEA